MKYCPNCGMPVQAAHKFCSNCGEPLPEQRAAPPAASDLPASERFKFSLMYGPQAGAAVCAPAFGGADPMAEFFAQTERLLAAGNSNEATYAALAKTFKNLDAKDVPARQMLEQGRAQAAEDSLAFAFYVWALHTVFGAF